MARNFAPEIKNAIRRLRNDGWSYSVLGNLIEADPRTVHRWCNYHSREKASTAKSEWYKNTRPRRREVASAYYKENKEVINAKIATWKKNNIDKTKKYSKKYKALNKSKCRYSESKRRVRKISAMPAWLTAEQKKEIRLMYDLAQILTVNTGTKYEVDHIYPLSHPTCCGLHVPWNLQVIPASDNRRKSNKLPCFH